MRKIWKIAAVLLAVAVLGVAAFGLTAFADESEDNPARPFIEFAEDIRGRFANKLGKSVEELDQTWMDATEDAVAEAVEQGLLTQDQADNLLSQSLCFGQFPRGPRQARINIVEHVLRDVVRIAAEQMDMTPQSLLTELRTGKSIADVAEEQGVDLQVITDAVLVHAQEDVDAAVENGRLTEEQAEAIMAEIEDALPNVLTRTYGSPRQHIQFQFVQQMQDIIAQELDMTVEELRAALVEGQSVADLAEERGVELQTIVDAILSAAEQELADLVEQGTITQEQADTILANLAEKLPEQLSQTRPSRGGMPQGGRGNMDERQWSPPFGGGVAPESGTDVGGRIQLDLSGQASA